MNKTKTEQFLFRGKEFETGAWIYGSLFDHKGHYPEIISMYLDKDGKVAYRRTCVQPETVSIWTGLTDCKGVKVFSGDILTVRICRYRNPDGEEGWETEYETKVGDMSSAFTVSLPEDCGYDFDATSVVWLEEHAYAEFEIEVTGNIYDTPEMKDR